ncbi:uncharacterized protein L201_006649 [Kwoniella dendrophila CBS 6074]|uniref:ThuA-like domain-containing protein n=1 Tax=Kwoniella dendrophila CBS 6074 TaxID=1295534 RepID=A0AAX4K3F6_9TREE
MTIIQLIFFIYLLLTRRTTASSSIQSFPAYLPNSINTPKILVYTYTDGFRHDSIPTAIEVLSREKVNWGLDFDFTENKTLFNEEYLKEYDALMFISVTGEAFGREGEKAFQKYLQSGGNFIGVHAATCALYNSSIYQATIGALFEWHPVIQEATFLREIVTHPATANLPDQWRFLKKGYFLGRGSVLLSAL